MDRVAPLEPTPISPNRTITGFRQDDEGHWVAVMDCGHERHVRHDPPWFERPWVLSEEGRRGRLGLTTVCARCQDSS